MARAPKIECTTQLRAETDAFVDNRFWNQILEALYPNEADSFRLSRKARFATHASSPSSLIGRPMK